MFYLLVYLCEGVRTPGTGVIDSGELPCGCWLLNLGPLEELSMLLAPEPSLQPSENMYFVDGATVRECY